MRDDIVARVAFALQDAGMTRLTAQRLAKAALSALQVGDRPGAGMIVSQEISPAIVEADRPRVVKFEPERPSV